MAEPSSPLKVGRFQRFRTYVQRRPTESRPRQGSKADSYMTFVLCTFALVCIFAYGAVLHILTDHPEPFFSSWFK